MTVALRPDFADDDRSFGTSITTAILVDTGTCPLFGATSGELKSITVPTCVIPGNDRVHPRKGGEAASKLIPHAELHDLMGPDRDTDLGPGLNSRAEDIAAILVSFLNRVAQ